jgi:hypothetical protein
MREFAKPSSLFTPVGDSLSLPCSHWTQFVSLVTSRRSASVAIRLTAPDFSSSRWIFRFFGELLLDNG